MDLHIRGNGIAISDDLREFADKRAAKLERLVRSVDEAKLELRHVHTRVGPDQIVAQLTLQSGRTLLRAEEHDPDARLAIDRAADKLEQQVRKVHSKRARRTGGGVASIRLTEALATMPDEDISADLGTEDDGSDLSADASGVVRTKRFPLKPMHVDEAIEQMELLGHDFYLFQNADDHTFSVLYRRRNGDYGLLLPDRA